MKELIAEPGFAVGGISTKSGLVLNCIQLTYYRVEDGKLDPTDDYRSDWIGVNSGKLEKLDGDDKPLIGVFGNASDNMHSLGLICAD